MTNLTSSIQVSEADIEADAEIVFEAMRWAVKNAHKGEPPKWFPRGNSFAQDEARRAAREIAMRSKDHSINREKLAIELHHASCANVPRHNPDYDRAHLPWEGVPPTGKQSWLAIADTAIALLAPPIAVDDVREALDELTRAVDAYATNNGGRYPTQRINNAAKKARTLSTGGKK